LTGETASTPDWTVVDEGWGRKATEFATLFEPACCREYVAMHHRLGIDAGDRLLDIACGSGLAIELAALRGADCAGIDASVRLVGVARDRSPQADIRVGDMHVLPWEDSSFTAVTSFRGIWGTTPAVIEEVWRVLCPGGRLGLTVYGHIKASAGAWAVAPLRMAAESKVAYQREMVALGRPGAGEELLTRCGFVDVQRQTVPCVWEFADPDAFARALSASGPAYEAIQQVGELAFAEGALQAARAHQRDGLPLRAEIDLVGYLARKPGPPDPKG
jgi:SAM-dependent methyltransferase